MRPPQSLLGPDRRLEPSELDGEEVLRHETHDEDRCREEDERDDEGRVVEDLALAEGRDRADDDRETELDHDRHDRQSPGDRQRPGEHIVDGLTGEGRAHVPLEDAHEVVEVLDDEGLVQVVLRLECVDHALRRLLVAEQGQDRVSRHREHEEIDEQGRPQEHGDDLQDAPEDVCEHPHSFRIRRRTARHRDGDAMTSPENRALSIARTRAPTQTARR
ncbi:hypothetical protein QE381_000297 [Microbacterium sp. SORGH_AS 888]|nr:hypothetical protein [Microbacterium sp. SORGH_AS_0888]